MRAGPRLTFSLTPCTGRIKAFDYLADWVDSSKRGGMDAVLRGLAGLLRGISRERSQREISRSSPASLRKTPSIPTLLLRFTFYLKLEICVIFQIFLNIDVWRSILVAKFLEYVYHLIRISIVLLWHCYIPKIHFNLMIFSLVKKTSTIITLIVSCNWIDPMLV